MDSPVTFLGRGDTASFTKLPPLFLGFMGEALKRQYNVAVAAYV